MRHLYNAPKWKILKLPGSELNRWEVASMQTAGHDGEGDVGDENDPAQEGTDEGDNEDAEDKYAVDEEDDYEAWHA
jgi:hypothetical protein